MEAGRRIESNRYQRWQTLKYYVLIALPIMGALGSGMRGVLDPVSLATRSLALSMLPALNYALNAGLDLLGRNPLYAVRLAGVILNLRITRFWCRSLCPLGALLGACSCWSIVGLEKSVAGCKNCNRCLLNCQGGDNPIPGAPWRKAECHLCMNCVEDCPEGGIRFRFFPGRRAVSDRANLKRRHALLGLSSGAPLVPLLRSTPGFAAETHERLLRPPGAVEEAEFLARCIRCGECMKVCPNNALHPALA